MNLLRLFWEKLYIEIPDFWRAVFTMLFKAEHLLIEVFKDERTSHDLIYEMQHAIDGILNNKLESDVIPLQHSNAIQEILTDVRR